eukprot:jgi/Tetstr1/461462/TSEL_006570.t1
MAALFVALDELLPYVPAANQDFTPYLARARNHAEAIDKAFRFRLAFLRRLNEIKRVHGDQGVLDLQLQDAGVGEDVAGGVDVAAKEAFGSDELGQRTLDLLSSSLSAQTLKSYAGRLSQFAEFCHDSENISPLEATTATVVRYVAWIGERGHIAAKSLQPYLSAINTFFELHNLIPIAKESLHLTSARRGLMLRQRRLDAAPLRVPLPADVAYRFVTKAELIVSAPYQEYHPDFRALLASVVNFMFFARNLLASPVDAGVRVQRPAVARKADPREAREAAVSQSKRFPASMQSSATSSSGSGAALLAAGLLCLACLAAGQAGDGLPLPKTLLTDEHLADALSRVSRMAPLSGGPGGAQAGNHTADIDRHGACKNDLKHHCASLLEGKPATKGRALLDAPLLPQPSAAAAGNQSAFAWLVKNWNMTEAMTMEGGELATCMRKVIQAQRMAITEPAFPVSTGCKQETRDYFAGRAADVRQDFALIMNCAPEIRQFCARVRPGNGRVVSCLKTNKLGLSQRCSSAVSRRQIESAEDISLDAKLATACAADLKKYCAHVGWGAGAAKSCLEGVAKRLDKSKTLEPTCKSALYRRALEDSEDIRYDYRASQACQADRTKFCPDVQPGKGRVIECLENHIKDKEFSAQCAKMLEKRMQNKSKDIRLDFRFRLLCRDDVRTLCPSFETLVTKPWVKSTLRGADLIECMRDNIPKIGNPKCQQHMYTLQKRGAMDPQLDSPLQRNCVAEIKELCSDIPPNRGFKLVNCLNKKKSEGYIISQMCTNVLLKRVSAAAKDFNLNPLVKSGCLREYRRFCKHDEDHGNSDDGAMECLASHKTEVGFGSHCKEVLEQFSIELMGDIRLVKDLHDGCAQEVKSLCATVEPGEGRIINCLQEKRSLVAGAECRAALLRITGMAADDWRMDYNLHKSCKVDVERFCAGVEPGGGRVHQCLRANEERISPSCRQMERNLEAIEHEDVRLSPRLRSCAPAVRRYCKDVPPGGAARIACLQDHMAEIDFPVECYNAMEEVIEKSSTRFYLNPRVKTMCNEDVNRFCRWSEMGSDPDSGILSCLASKVQQAQPECRRELVRVVRLQLWRYKAGMPLTSPCDGDAMRHCDVGSVAGPFLQPGYVAECLMKHSADVSRGCWALISLPEAEGVRAAAKLEAKYWHREFAQEALQAVAGSVEANLHDRLHGALQHHMERHVEEHVDRAFRRSGPAWLMPILIIAGGLVALGGVVWFSFAKGGLQPGRMMVVKDGRA